MRRYEHGMGWAFWRWTDVDWKGKTYLFRLHILKTPKWGALMLHWFMGPDPHPDPHDHPISFLSITIRGGYTEWRPGEGYNRKRIRFTQATDTHKVIEVDPGTLTLVFAGPVTRSWGYHTRVRDWTTKDGITGTIWIPWKQYRDIHAR